MKVLILSCSTGGGHNACAKYILDELKLNNIDCEFKDFYDIVNKKMKNFSEKLYLSTLNGNGKIFKTVYKLGELLLIKCIRKNYITILLIIILIWL